MIGLEQIEKSIHDFETELIMAKTDKKNIESKISSLKSKIASLESSNDMLTRCIAVLTQAGTQSRDSARTHFEKIITDALQFVTQSTDYEFVIKELTGRQKASYEFYIKSTVNGVECIQKPEEANGGGFVDIISVAMKYAYLEIFNDPKVMSGTLLYDEPGKMISADMSVKFAEYIKFLGKQYGRQTIMITHNENLANVADKTYIVSKGANGVSKVEEPQSVSTVMLQNIVGDLLGGDTSEN